MNRLLKQYKKRWVPIIDAGIGTKRIKENIAYPRAQELGILLKNAKGEEFRGSVWPGDSRFPDFFHPKAEQFWHEMLEHLDKQLSFDGIWLDMNEVANFCDGECGVGPSQKYKNLPFTPGNTNLERKTISFDAVHYGGIEEFYAHSLFGLLEQKATYNYLKKKTPLPFILTRANMFGTGKYAAHWFGDTTSGWTEMRYTIGELLNYNMWGIPQDRKSVV